ncbi:HD-GYP domain-containing protein [Pseudodesulfovibrio tunisiensis]|uniref:HD-GYP domain-containing protein n=1 Tax=Pseudodesulfovibrio tunisiensis TaxID=463192 RepID=UPI001FB46AC5|nr:HD-GYP domain-containing protein [Pseudodesulfovibrio tunisiensis]
MIKKVPVSELRPGMEVVKLHSDVWEHLPYLYTTPGPIRDRDEVVRIEGQGYRHAFIHVPDNETPRAERLETVISDPGYEPPEKQRSPFDQEIQITQMAYENAMVHARRIVSDVKMGRQIDYEATSGVVRGIIESAVRNPDTLICISKLSRYDEYTYSHSINVAAIAVVFGEYLGMGRDELRELGTAGMLHDIGKTAIAEDIINKRGRLSEKEFSEIRKHPVFGHDILRRQPAIPDIVLDAVRQHHEKFNGAGYPGKLMQNAISPYARILSLADVYDALTSDRSYKDAILPNKALAIMYGMRGQDFDTTEVQLFIKCLGIFPAGSLVRLNTGKYGVVCESNPKRPLLPKIKIILDEDLRPIPAELVDLAARQTLHRDRLEILECADPGQYRINLKPFLFGS